jgi:hypothetical protein
LNKFNNFYNEPAHARALASYISSAGQIPDAVQKVNDTEANRTQQFRETAFKRVSRGSAKSELPVNLSSSGLI